MAIAFNGKYIMDFLKITDNEFINLNLNSSIDPCVITSVVEDGFLYLVLPVRINA
jgi:DNA polymerase-3 subunit beta